MAPYRLDVRRLLTLRQVVAHGSIAAAADAMRVTASAVSQQVSALERAVGVPLIVRSNRGVEPTPAGERLVARADAIVAELERADAELAGYGGPVAGPVSIGAFASAIRGVVAPALPALRAEHPQLQPRVRELDPVDALDELVRGGIDVALLYTAELLERAVPDACEVEHVADDPMLLAVPADEFPDGGDEPDLVDLARHEWLTAWPGSSCHELTVRACSRAGFLPTIHAASHEFDVLLALVAGGSGVALIPRLGIGPAGTPPGVRLVAPRATQPVRHLQLAWRRGARERPAIAAALDGLRAAAGALQPA